MRLIVFLTTPFRFYPTPVIFLSCFLAPSLLHTTGLADVDRFANAFPTAGLATFLAEEWSDSASTGIPSTAAA
jgi:hypothetical protein